MAAMAEAQTLFRVSCLSAVGKPQRPSASLLVAPRGAVSVASKGSLRQCQLGALQRGSQAERSQIRQRLALVVRAGAEVDQDEVVAAVEEDAMERMDKTLEKIRGNFNTVRTGRATPSLLDRVEVEYYGTNVTLKSIAQVSTPDSATLMITPFDKSSIASIEKALMTSDVGLTPNSDGNNIRLSIPQLTQERRKELMKTVSKLAEEGKVAIRNVRRDALKAYDKLEKEKKLSEDKKKGCADDLQKMTDDYVKQIEGLFKQKEKELLTV